MASRPPGPGGLRAIDSLLRARRDPLGFALNLGHRYGEVVRYRIGPYSGYLVRHPDHVRHVLEGNQQNYGKHTLHYAKLKPVLGEGLITSDGDRWKRQRDVVHPIVHGITAAQIGATTLGVTERILGEWETSARDGRPVDIAEAMTNLTMNVIGLMVFGSTMDEQARHIMEAFTTINEDVAFRFRAGYVLPSWTPTPRNLAARTARARLDAVVDDMIERRRRKSADGDDVLGRLLQCAARGDLSDAHVRDQAMTLLLAGHETTAMLLAWTLFLLASHPETDRRMEGELREFAGLGESRPSSDLARLPYLERVLLESLRLYPPVWVISRRAREADVIGGYAIPAGTDVTLSSYVTHRHPDFWEQPEAFDPDRFAPERRRGRHPFAYFPFGGGERRCLGSHFSMVEAKLVIAAIRSRFRLELLSDQRVEAEPLVTLRPRGGVVVRLHSASP